MVQSMVTMLHKMEHHIQTTYGDSTVLASQTTWQAPIASIGQGNGVGLQIWAAVSSPMFNLMRLDGFYAHIIAAISRKEKTLVGLAFVDNTNLCVHGPHINSTNIQTTMQQSVDNWEGLLQSTSGALIPTKCFWYLINFQLTQNKWKYITKHQKLGELSIKDDLQHWVMIPWLETNKARHTLGVCLAPDGNWDTKLEYLMLVTSDWKIWMVVSHLSPTNVTFSLKNVIMQKICYPLVTMTFSPQQCFQIMAPILQQGLPKAGMVCTFPRDLAHGPLDYRGLEIPHLYTEQLVTHVQMFYAMVQPQLTPRVC